VTPRDFAALFEEFRAESWAGWRCILARLTPAMREFYAIAGRGSGKSRVVALLAACYAAREYRRAPGERIYVGVFAPDRKQATVTFKYVVGLLRSVPELEALIENELRESVELRSGVTVEVLTASKAAPRGRSYALAIVEEAAFLPTGDAADPDTELVRALRPALARVPGSLLAVVSSAYARRGVLYDAWRRNEAEPTEDVLVVKAGTLELNPTFDAAAIEKARREDPVSAAAEYDSAFRVDVESYISREAVAACVVSDRRELLPAEGVRFSAFTDLSGGGSGRDSSTVAVGHLAKDGVVVLDAIRARRPPFSPEAVVREFSELLHRYRITRVVGDRWAGEWAREPFRKLGIDYRLADQAKSDLYRDLLPVLNSGKLELLDHPGLIAELVGLERRTARGGRDTIDHAPGGHDDLANALAGVVALLVQESTRHVRVTHMATGEELHPLTLRRLPRARVDPATGWPAIDPKTGWPISR